MSLEKARTQLEKYHFEDRIIIPERSSATVEEAAAAIGAEPGQIAKTLAFIVGEDTVLILAEGTVRIDNKKFRGTFHKKAKMIPWDEVEERTGHAPGGVCPFGVKPDVKVYLDESLKRHETVYPAAGTDHSAVRLTVPELEQVSECLGWVDVCG